MVQSHLSKLEPFPALLCKLRVSCAPKSGPVLIMPHSKTLKLESTYITPLLPLDCFSRALDAASLNCCYTVVEMLNNMLLSPPYGCTKYVRQWLNIAMFQWRSKDSQLERGPLSQIVHEHTSAQTPALHCKISVLQGTQQSEIQFGAISHHRFLATPSDIFISVRCLLCALRDDFHDGFAVITHDVTCVVEYK